MSAAEVSAHETNGEAVDAQALEELRRWLVAQGLADVPAFDLVAGYCERMTAAGVPLYRARISFRILHPTYGAASLTWMPDSGVTVERYTRADDVSAVYRQSPTYWMVSTRCFELYCDLEKGEGFSRFPSLKEFAEEGMTAYAAKIVPFGDPEHPDPALQGVFFSATTKRPGGFTEPQIAALGSLLPELALTLKGLMTRQVANILTRTYLGPRAGRRVLEGAITRGHVDSVDCPLLLADLRGFTALSERLPPEELVALLNRYFEVTLGAIEAAGGEVVKLIGDGCIAIFPDEKGAEAALKAARDMAAAAHALSAAELFAGGPAMALDVVLHAGALRFGNIGGLERLDFTVIGAAVNEASRMENACSADGGDMLVSAAFLERLGTLPDDVLPIGEVTLRGVPRPLKLWRVASACRPAGEAIPELT